ncbi:MAG TPA: hypothetical protein V6C65_14695 [Allocoleopsis sp.]
MSVVNFGSFLILVILRQDRDNTLRELSDYGVPSTAITGPEPVATRQWVA